MAVGQPCHTTSLVLHIGLRPCLILAPTQNLGQSDDLRKNVTLRAAQLPVSRRNILPNNLIRIQEYWKYTYTQGKLMTYQYFPLSIFVIFSRSCYRSATFM